MAVNIAENKKKKVNWLFHTLSHSKVGYAIKNEDKTLKSCTLNYISISSIPLFIAPMQKFVPDPKMA